MSAALLLKHFGQIADTPNAIARMRRFIRDLAVRGKLVGQDPNDEPALKLLEQIATDRVTPRSKAKAVPLNTNGMPFALPEGWCWSKLGEVCSKTGSGSTPRGGKEVYKDGGTPFLRSQNIYDDGLRLDDVAFIDAETHGRMASTKVLPRDLLLNITGGSMGRCCRVPDDFDEANVSQHVAIIRPAVRGTEDFLHLLVLSPYFQAFIFDEQTGAGRGGLPKNRMDNIAIALPPLAEQHRIVAKVDELMELCDQLEAARAEREYGRDKLTTASLARLNAPDPETFANDARFALDNLKPLTTRADQIKQLRQTIINLAVQGKLVEQDPNEVPASEQLKRLPQAKELLLNAGNTSRSLRKPIRIPNGRTDQRTGWVNVEAAELFPTRSGNSKLIKGKLHAEAGDGRYPGYSAAGQDVWLDDWEYEGTAIILSAVGARCGKAFLAQGRWSAIANTHIVWLMPSITDPAFAMLHLNNEDFWQRSGGAQPFVKVGDTLTRLFPLPPLAEQQRIVAKVDELMELCDHLEESLTNTDRARSNLLGAALQDALEAA